MKLRSTIILMVVISKVMQNITYVLNIFPEDLIRVKTVTCDVANDQSSLHRVASVSMFLLYP